MGDNDASEGRARKDPAVIMAAKYGTALFSFATAVIVFFKAILTSGIGAAFHHLFRPGGGSGS